MNDIVFVIAQEFVFNMNIDDGRIKTVVRGTALKCQNEERYHAVCSCPLCVNTSRPLMLITPELSTLDMALDEMARMVSEHLVAEHDPDK